MAAIKGVRRRSASYAVCVLFGLAACGLSVSALTGCTKTEDAPPARPVSDTALSLTDVRFADLPGWNTDHVAKAAAAFARSCERIKKLPLDRAMGDAWAGRAADWQAACAALPPAPDDQTARRYFEDHFRVVAASAGKERQGLFTGYFEASLNGSMTRQGQYQTPVLAKPADLVSVDLGQFKPEWKGQRTAGRVVDGVLRPYESRAGIDDGQLPTASEIPLLWVDDPVALFFLQIQGSGIVTLTDGTTRRIGYDGQNGHPYSAIGKELIRRGALQKDNVSMQTIKDWLYAHPLEGREVMRTNPSYVFFRFADDGPKGGEGVALTPMRSLAVDRGVLPYGMPVFLSAEQGFGDHLMVAQDTGGAIRGAVRGDIFYGHGPDAEALAGPMQAKGKYWFLLPKPSAP